MHCIECQASSHFSCFYTDLQDALAFIIVVGALQMQADDDDDEVMTLSVTFAFSKQESSRRHLSSATDVGLNRFTA